MNRHVWRVYLKFKQIKNKLIFPTNYPTPITTLPPAVTVTHQMSSRKSAKNMDKKELEVKFNRHTGKGRAIRSSLKELNDEIKGLKVTIEELKKKENSIIHLQDFINVL